jgi:hypothetical protein
MNNIALELAALTRKAPLSLTDKHDSLMLIWALENTEQLPEQPREREGKIEALSREVCVKRLKLLENEMDHFFVGGGYVSQLKEASVSGDSI